MSSIVACYSCRKRNHHGGEGDRQHIFPQEYIHEKVSGISSGSY